MKCSFLGIVSLMTFCGCSDPVAFPSEVAVAMSNHLMNRLSSNASVRVSDIHQEMDKWKHYQALVEYRECAIENLELNGFDDRVYNVGTERMDAIRVKFEKMIGRSVRPRSAINRLGQYQKKVRARIEQEMKDTLGLEKKKVLDR